MKKVAVVVLLIVSIAAVVLACGGFEREAENASYLRVHIRANSNGAEDQEIKYRVRDKVVAFLTPVIAECDGKEEAVEAIGSRLREIERVAECELRAGGFSYGARAEIRREEFPTRVYDGLTLGAGVYDALILELGTGEGDNWWCVVYPPLCFTAGNGNIVYRSKIVEMIRAFFS